ncbi:Frequency clock protein [Fusarium oxysporum f. sp. raphani]|uniref:Frequency clock protein n=1 Tax=Fusarium oxysporum f. sp. raphani TaxID=96318 RepID=A0A8J5TQP2_FUSOX|nr:Frequency clock protein [Fusarium oxysporum f. sp. raphani]
MPLNQSNPEITPPQPTACFLHLDSFNGSRETVLSDPPEWHNDLNLNATTNNNPADDNLSFSREESDLLDTEKLHLHTRHQVDPPGPITAHSSRSDDYRSVIDDLTLEIQQLKKELKRYKQPGPALLHKDKLFEIKVYGLPQKKKRELETILRDLAADHDGSPKGSSSQKRKRLSTHNSDHIYSKSGVQRSPALSSTGFSLRPADSAYASMSAGGESSRTPFYLPILPSTKSSKGKVEDYLRDVPDGLYPQHVIMTDKERKSLVVRRLEQFFTGRSNSADVLKLSPLRPGGSFIMARVVADTQVAGSSSAYQPTTHETEPIREARFLPLEQQSRAWEYQCHLSDHGSASNPEKDNIEAEGNGKGLVSSTKPFPPFQLLPKQQATRPCDLDPDRAQNPSENMNYIRHLDLLSPDILPGQQSIQDIHLDPEGWVSLNLLYNLAQLHLINVTPDFVRSAVLEISTKFQLSTDGHKIRWRGGSKDTKFSSHIAIHDSPKSPPVNNIDGSEKTREHQKTSPFINNESQFGGLNKNVSAFDPRFYARVENFRYKPLFVREGSSDANTSQDASVYSPIAVDDDNPGESDLGLNYSGGSAGKLQRREGAITYYSSVPFCTDLSGDPVDVSPTVHMPWSGQKGEDPQQSSDFIWSLRRTTSESSISYRPLTDRDQGLRQLISAMYESDDKDQGSINNDCEPASDIELDLIWNDDQQQYVSQQQPLEACGFGGVLPDDHFIVVVDTKRPKQDILPQASKPQTKRPNEGIDGTIDQRAATLTSYPIPGGSETKITEQSLSIEIEYLSGHIKRLTPVPLPAPVMFFPPVSVDNSTSGEYDELPIDRDNTGSSEEDMS